MSLSSPWPVRRVAIRTVTDHDVRWACLPGRGRWAFHRGTCQTCVEWFASFLHTVVLAPDCDDRNATADQAESESS